MGAGEAAGPEASGEAAERQVLGRPAGREHSQTEVRPDGGSSCRMELTGLDVPERGTLSGERCLGIGRGELGILMPFLLCPPSPHKYHKNCTEGLLGSSAGGAGAAGVPVGGPDVALRCVLFGLSSVLKEAGTNISLENLDFNL